MKYFILILLTLWISYSIYQIWQKRIRRIQRLNNFFKHHPQNNIKNSTVSQKQKIGKYIDFEEVNEKK